MSDSSRKSHGIGAAVDKLFRGIEILIAIFLGAMIFFTFMNVILRQFGIGFPWSEEIARICFIYLIYLGAIIAARENQHLMIDTLICKLPPLGQKVLYVIIQGLIIWLMWILTNGAFLNAWNNRNDFWVATHFPVFLVHFAGVLLGASVIIISLVNLYRMFVLKEPVIELLTGHKADDGEDPIAKEGGGLQCSLPYLSPRCSSASASGFPSPWPCCCAPSAPRWPWAAATPTPPSSPAP